MDSSALRDELQKLKDSGQLRANPIIYRYRPRNKEAVPEGTTLTIAPGTVVQLAGSASHG